MKVKRSARYNAIWATIGTISQVASQTLAIIILAHLLSPQEFGIVSAATLVTQLLIIFLEFGIGPYIVHRDELDNSCIESAFFLSLSLGFLMAGLLWLSAPVFAIVLNIPELSLVLKPYAAMFVISGFIATYDAIRQRNFDFKYLAFADGISFSVGFAFVSIFSAILGFSYWSLVFGHLSQCVIRAIIIRSGCPAIITTHINYSNLKLLIHFGLGQTLSRFANYIGGQADSFIVTHQLGVSAIGLYGRANQLVTMPAIQLGQIFDKVLFPMVARTQKDTPRAANTYLTAISGICLLSIPITITIWIFGEQLVHIALGKQWHEVIEPLKILALAIPFRLIHKVSDPVARAFGKTYSRAWRQSIYAAYIIISTLIFCSYGLAAVAWCVVSAALLDALLMMTLCATVTQSTPKAIALSFIPGIQAGAISGVLFIFTKELIKPWNNNDFTSLIVAAAIPFAVIAAHIFYHYQLNRGKA